MVRLELRLRLVVILLELGSLLGLVHGVLRNFHVLVVSYLTVNFISIDMT